MAGNTKRRIDMWRSPDAVTPFVEDSNGYLTGRATVTTIGVYTYMDESGNIVRELRHPDDVFAPESTATLSMIPVTLTHPANFVTKDNVKDLSVGMTGEFMSSRDDWGTDAYYCMSDGTNLTIGMKIQRADAIEAVKNGMRGLSCGYTCEIVDEKGVYLGMEYDCRQKNIRYNHVAIVDEGRAGDTARIKMDDAFIPVCVHDGKAVRTEDEGHNNSDRRKDNMKTLRIDSTDYTVDDAVVKHVDALTAERDTLKGQVDTANIKMEELKQQMDGMVSKDDVAGLVKEYKAVEDVADRYGVSLNADASLMDMKKEIIKQRFPSLKSNLDSASDEYVNGVFATCMADAPVKKQNVHADEQDSQDEEFDEDSQDEMFDDAEHMDGAQKILDGLNTRLSEKYGA